MVTKELSEAAVEINSIFNNMSINLLNKIPVKIRNFFFEISSKKYTFEYDKSKTLNEQNLLPMTKGILALIYRDYLCNDIEKEKYIKEYKKTLMLIEQKKQEKYNSDNLFKSEANTKYNSAIDTLPVIPKKISFFDKIINKIKNILQK